MSTSTDIFGEAFIAAIREAVRTEMQAARGNGNKESELLTAEELAKKLKVPVSWWLRAKSAEQHSNPPPRKVHPLFLERSVGKSEEELTKKRGPREPELSQPLEKKPT